MSAMPDGCARIEHSGSRRRHVFRTPPSNCRTAQCYSIIVSSGDFELNCELGHNSSFHSTPALPWRRVWLGGLVATRGALRLFVPRDHLGDLMKLIFAAAAFVLCAGCAQHRLIVAYPNPTGDAIEVSSNAFVWGGVQRRTVAECDTNLIDEVRVKHHMGQALATVLTLGMWSRVELVYVCAKIPASTGSTDDSNPAPDR